MRMYSPSTGCSYIPGINHEIPKDAVEISEETFRQVLGVSLEADEAIGHTAEGQPTLVARTLTKEELEWSGRSWRDAVIEKVKWLRERHRDELDLGAGTTLTLDKFAELLAYIQSLRKWPEVEGFPSEGSKPNPPEWLSAFWAAT